MKRLVEYPVTEGNSILVEVDVPIAGDKLVPAASANQMLVEAQESLGAALERVVPAANEAIMKMRALADSPDSLEISFGLKLTGGVNLIIASGNAEANFIVKLSWKGEPSSR